MSCRPNQCNPLADSTISHSFRKQGNPDGLKFLERVSGADALAYRQPAGARPIVLEFLQEWSAVAGRSPAFACEIGGWVF
jgi:hypothetical protein